tara:strand:+ start:173 stop:469 length:297 start_codon:yes stop_codon:yes gene_type:complete
MSINKPLYNATANGNVEFTEEEYSEYEASLPKVESSYQEHLEKTIRLERNAKLTACDWTQAADAPVDQAAWATYRQSLRDIPSQAGFPNAINWPVEPE